MSICDDCLYKHDCVFSLYGASRRYNCDFTRSCGSYVPEQGGGRCAVCVRNETCKSEMRDWAECYMFKHRKMLSN